MVASLGTDLERRIGDYMSDGHPTTHGDHGGHEKKVRKARRPHEVPDEAKKVFEKFIDEICDEEFYFDAHTKHNKAYKEAVGAIDDTAATNTEEAVDVLTDALIKYRTEMAYATDNKPKMDKKDYHTFLKGNKTYL